jgi:hypothetical protein
MGRGIGGKELTPMFVFGLLGSIAVAAASPAKDTGSYVKVEICGILRHGVMAIGGETTGTTITAGSITWELDLSVRKPLRKLAERLNGAMAVVRGTLEKRRGVEIKDRWIVKVRSLKKASARTQKQLVPKRQEPAPSKQASGDSRAAGAASALRGDARRKP